ncbi:MBL fold metallo-hydrolase [Actinomadura sp. ATCC 31491]|uniref:MBL fold metallo-hydrolase n=1 Tax=Actinomadura luzonensis TaxID=2805427 RepID=A0ABT0FQT7_9ACTN|nr:MBL fold metallo-hydrolase [Actinomadura luzonensis]MCK2214518.1 MBL fold metallo-hydrolase [Actinomadura luzonensis]
MPHTPITVSGVEVTPLCDAVGPMGAAIRRPLPEMFPGSGLPDEPWVLHFHCYLLRSATGRLTLVDTGIGGTGSPAASWAPVPGTLAGELAAAGVAPADVETVVLTHLHSDHASGVVTDDGRPAFENARHVLQRAELDAAQGGTLDRLIAPIKDLVQVVEGDAEVAPGVRAHLAPGHTPGHQIVRAGDVAMTGDLVLHPAQLADPAVRYVYDDDQEAAARTRAEVLERLRAERAVLATAHFSEPFVRL